jgi:glycolate oxidase iron-sulfur subunit
MQSDASIADLSFTKAHSADVGSVGILPGVSDDLLAGCVHCGFCVPVCPTWDILREENDSPRGRLYLMRAEEEGRLDASGAFTIHMGRCLGCRACETVCPAGVPYGHLLERARSRIPVPPVTRKVRDWVLGLLASPGTHWVYGVARFFRGFGLATLLGRVLPGGMGRAFRLLDATRPRLGHRAGAEPGPSRPSSARGSPEAPYVLLVGCVMEGLFGHVHAATRRTLSTVGFREVDAPDQVCCGALHAHTGRMTEARRLARMNIAAFEAAPEAWIVSDSAGCGAALRDYPAWMERDTEWRDRAIAVAGRVRDVTELLAEALDSEAAVAADVEADAGPGTSRGRLPGRVGYDAPCHLHHGQGVTEQPLAVLQAVADLHAEPLPSSERCCGGAGLYNLVEPELAGLVAEPKLEEVGRGDYDWIATGNPGCIMYMAAGLRKSGIRVPVVHPVELVDLAWHGGPGEDAG